MALLSAGCAALAGSAASGFADNLSAAILDQEDPDLVREGLPAYLILLDALVRSDPDNPRNLGAAAQLYAAYGIAFTTDPQRAGLLTRQARDYGRRALCSAEAHACGLDALDFDAFAAVVDGIGSSDADALFSYAVGSLAYIRGHSGEWSAIAGLPQAEHALRHLLDRPAAGNLASVNMYLGILNTLRPPALGGRPEEGRAFFEKAIELSDGQDLTAKVEFARGYARLVYDRELHDRLLNEVLAAPVRSEGHTLFNAIARREAANLLASANDYF